MIYVQSQDQVSELTNRLADVAERLGDQQAKNRALGGEVIFCGPVSVVKNYYLGYSIATVPSLCY